MDVPRNSKRIHNVAVILRLAGASGRDLLSGISRYARENCHWRMTVVNGPDLPPARRKAFLIGEWALVAVLLVVLIPLGII